MGPLPSRAVSFLVVITSAIAFKVRVLAQSATGALPFPYNQPWPQAEKHGAWPPAQTNAPSATQPQPAETPAQQTTQPPPVTTPAQDVGNQNQNAPGTNPNIFVPAPPPPAAPKNQIGASGDFMLGQGNVSLPLLYSLSRFINGLSGTNSIKSKVASANRSSTYFGGTLSYTRGETWYFDFAYAKGTSSGSTPVNFGNQLGVTHNLNSQFSIDDTWYQAYVRYSFPQLRGGKWSAFARAGFTYIDATLTDNVNIPNFGEYNQNDKTTDLRGNLGFELGYNIHTGPRFRVGVRVDGEGFFGTRSQDSLETLTGGVFGTSKSQFPTAHINNTLYGGIGRGTVHAEYLVGRSGLMKIFADGGIQSMFTEVSYPSSGTIGELLWGPYADLGLSYSF